MKKVWRTRGLMGGAVWLLLALTGCDAAQDFTSPGEPITHETQDFAAFEASVLDQARAAGVAFENSPAERPLFLSDPDNEWVAVEGDVGDESVEAVIGIAGGELRLGDHWLLVPAGTVVGPVRFRMTPVDDGTMHVDLTATSVNSAVENDVGAAGFTRHVYLSFAVDPTTFDPESLGVAWLVDGAIVLQQSFTYEDDHVVGALNHFSGYVLVAN